MPGDRRPSDAPDGRSDADRSQAASAGTYLGLGLQFAGSILLFFFAGRWLDRRLGSDPWFLFLGTFTGAAAGFYSIYRRLMADLKREEEAKRLSKNKP
jgi:F0F1-type ATP synthase assembly protein I